MASALLPNFSSRSWTLVTDGYSSDHPLCAYTLGHEPGFFLNRLSNWHCRKQRESCQVQLVLKVQEAKRTLKAPCRASKDFLNRSETRNARDIPLNFGKYQRKLLGSVPKSYLLWIIRYQIDPTLMGWPNLAQKVLDDPRYQERIQWNELMRQMDNMDRAVSVQFGRGPGWEEHCNKYGWDPDEKLWWQLGGFEKAENLIGTSYFGIPKLNQRKLGEMAPLERIAVPKLKARVMKVGKEWNIDLDLDAPGRDGEMNRRTLRRERRKLLANKQDEGQQQEVNEAVNGKEEGKVEVAKPPFSIPGRQVMLNMVSGDDFVAQLRSLSEASEDSRVVGRRFKAREAEASRDAQGSPLGGGMETDAAKARSARHGDVDGARQQQLNIDHEGAGRSAPPGSNHHLKSSKGSRRPRVAAGGRASWHPGLSFHRKANFVQISLEPNIYSRIHTWGLHSDRIPIK